MATPIGRPVSPTYTAATPPAARVAPPASTPPALETSKPVQTQESFAAARQSVVGKSTETVNPSQGGAQVKQGIDQVEPGQLLEQGQSLMESPVVKAEFSDGATSLPKLPPPTPPSSLPPPPPPPPKISSVSPQSGRGSITPEMLVQAREKLKPISQHQVLNLEKGDTIVTESSRSVVLKDEGSAFAPERLSAKSTLELVGHGAEDGTTLGGKTPQQVASMLKQAGITQLAVLDLKSCYSANFKIVLEGALKNAGIHVGDIRTYRGQIAVSRETGKVIQGNDLEQIQKHDGVLGINELLNGLDTMYRQLQFRQISPPEAMEIVLQIEKQLYQETNVVEEIDEVQQKINIAKGTIQPLISTSQFMPLQVAQDHAPLQQSVSHITDPNDSDDDTAIDNSHPVKVRIGFQPVPANVTTIKTVSGEPNIKGNELIGLMDGVVQDFVREALSSGPLQDGCIISGSDFLKTANEMTLFKTTLDKTVSGDSQPKVLFRVGMQQISLKFDPQSDRLFDNSGKDQSYAAILQNIQPLIGQMGEAGYARHLLDRYQDGNYAEPQSAFVNALLFGLEGSRNHASYGTGLMTLELIAAGRMTFQNAFQHSSLGGEYPMASVATGKDNLSHRGGEVTIAKDHMKIGKFRGMKPERGSNNFSTTIYGKSQTIPVNQHTAVQLKEAAIIKNWLLMKGVIGGALKGHVELSLEIQHHIQSLMREYNYPAQFYSEEN